MKIELEKETLKQMELYEKLLIIYVILILFLAVGTAVYISFRDELNCEKELVCYYKSGGGVFTSASKIYVDCDDRNFIPIKKEIIKEWVCK